MEDKGLGTLHIWLVSIFEQTPVDGASSTRFLCLAEELLKKGHKVTFIASTFKHNTKTERFTETTKKVISDDYEVHYIKSQPYEGNISAARLRSHWRYAKDLISYLPNLSPPDVVHVAFPPISIGYMLSKWCNIKGIPMVLDIIDPWPDLFLKVIPHRFRPLSKLLISPLKSRLRNTLKRSSGVTAISNEYITWSSKYWGVSNKECFYPAVDFSEVRNKIDLLKSSLPKKEDFRIIYAGSFASSYDIECILNAAEIIDNSDNPNIRFRLAGSGPKEKMIIEFAEKCGNIDYLGRLSKEDLLKEYIQADAGLIQHVKGATQSVTYKLFDLLSCGLSVINSLDSEMKDIILENNVGFYHESGNAHELARIILVLSSDPILREEQRQNALDLTAREGDSANVYGRLAHFLEKTQESFGVAD